MNPDLNPVKVAFGSWPSFRVLATGLVLSAGLAGGIWGFTRWPELPQPVLAAGLRRQWVSDAGAVRAWRLRAGDPTQFARPDAPGFSEAVRAHRPVVAYQVTEYQPPIKWLDSGGAGERIGPKPVVAEPASARHTEPTVRFAGETLPEPLTTSTPLVYPRGMLWKWPIQGTMPVFPSAPAGATLTGPTQIQLAAGPSGTLVIRRLARSCGDPAVDQLALERCRSLQFVPRTEDPGPLLDAQGPLVWGDLQIYWTVAPPAGS